MMKIKKRSFICLGMLMLWTTGAVADDGPMFRKNVSNTPDLETEFATIRMLPLYVPPQSSDGTILEGIDYYKADDETTPVETRGYVRPLINHYTDGAVTFIEEEGYGGFPGHGRRDAYGAVSLDDGATWKRTNLSKSGDLSSIKIKVGRKLVPYYGDVGRTFTASDGNQVLVTWVSKYCGSGSPAYSMTATEQSLLATHLAASRTVADAGICSDGDPLTPCPYLEDSFGVAGSQGVQKAADLAEDGYPLVGDYPFSCVWAARGVMLPPAVEGGVSTFTWFKAERLSSGVRSANRPEAVCVKGAGCVVTWQEDPEGIRPGEGEGPGEGWSGAVAHHQTDTWYSYIDWNDFGLVSGDETYGSFYNTTGSLAAWVAANPTGSPKAAVPMAIPMRLTDNAMCTATDSKPYCFVDYDGSGTADFCAYTIPVAIVTPEGPSQTIEMCVTEDGRLMRGTTASTRARLGLHGYSSDASCAFDKTDPDKCPIDSAWFYVTYEENKGLGDICDDGYCEDGELTEADKRDMGKNVWYHTFDMFKPELVSQGMMLNQPAVYPAGWTDPTGLLEAAPLSGFNFYAFTADPIYESQAGILTSTLYQTEIARRPSVISQDWYDAGPSGLVGFQLWKQGIIRRGGPADIMARRFVMPTAAEQVCTTEYKACTTEPVCTTENVCTIEKVCTDNAPNPAYDYKASICKRNPLLSRCYPYLDGSGTPTLEPQTCEEGVEICKDVTTCNDETTCETVTSCDGYVNCEAVEICTGGLDDNDNPYGYDKMECVNPDGSSAWAFTDGSNPRYVKGLCAASAINLSGNTVLTSETCGDAANCLTVFPFNDYYDDLDMTDAEPISKILTWQQYGVNNGEILTSAWSLHDNVNSLDDQSWENPYDMAKGHRGFLAGDMVMAMYGWTNNWKALTEAKDIVNLYVRRSFDGGRTWTTLPASFTHTNGITYSGDGTTNCEFMGPTGAETEFPVCATYGAGEFEQARNVSQLLGSKVTVLDPRYTPTTRTINEAWVGTSSLPEGFTAPLYDDDTRDPSRFFMVYETGHSSAYDAGEAPPLDLFYSRAVDWGDDYMVWGHTIDECIIAEETPGFCNEFDAIEGSQLFESGEASVTCSPGGQFFYAVWNQWDFDKDGNEIGADDWFRRILFLDPVIDDGGGTE
ncbi:MAG: hypothetical protein F9K32_14195 [Desulfobulbaceae bacterium]|nr:MAG: hypothetical protein F9K32_14195 [Desulfobulbaceae bacterium]